MARSTASPCRSSLGSLDTWYVLPLFLAVCLIPGQTPFYLITAYTRQIVPSLDPTSLSVALPVVVMDFCLGIGRVSKALLFHGSISPFFATDFEPFGAFRLWPGR